MSAYANDERNRSFLGYDVAYGADQVGGVQAAVAAVADPHPDTLNNDSSFP